MWQAPQSESQRVLDKEAGRPDHSGRILYGHMNPDFYVYRERVKEEFFPWDVHQAPSHQSAALAGVSKNAYRRQS